MNNAFVSGRYDPVDTADFADWRRVMDVNLFGSLQLTQAVVPHMKARGEGSVVMVNSMSIRIIEPRFGAYTASKAALLAATQTLAKELGPAGIRVNSVVPGYIWSDKLAAYFRQLAQQQGTTFEAVKAEIAGRTALNHIPDSAEIAAAVVFFASDLCACGGPGRLDVKGGHYSTDGRVVRATGRRGRATRPGRRDASRALRRSPHAQRPGGRSLRPGEPRRSFTRSRRYSCCTRRNGWKSRKRDSPRISNSACSAGSRTKMHCPPVMTS